MFQASPKASASRLVIQETGHVSIGFTSRIRDGRRKKEPGCLPLFCLPKVKREWVQTGREFRVKCSSFYREIHTGSIWAVDAKFDLVVPLDSLPHLFPGWRMLKQILAAKEPCSFHMICFNAWLGVFPQKGGKRKTLGEVVILIKWAGWEPVSDTLLSEVLWSSLWYSSWGSMAVFLKLGCSLEYSSEI